MTPLPEDADVEDFLQSTANSPRSPRDQSVPIAGKRPAPWLILPEDDESKTTTASEGEMDSKSSDSQSDKQQQYQVDFEDETEGIEYLSGARPVWVPDNAAPHCASCEAQFSFTKRRHHCRACGRVFCSACCNQKIDLPHLGYKSRQLVCCECILALPYK